MIAALPFAILTALLPATPATAQAPDAATLTARCDQDRDADSCMAMAIKSYEGRDVKLDHVRARRFAAKACAEGKALGCNLLAALLQDGAGGPRDLSGAARNYRRACTGGYQGACFNLGQLLYDHYAGDPAHLVEARAMFARGCDAGLADSCNNHAVMLKFAEGGARDLPAARRLFDRACSGGIANACANFGYMLHAGEGGAKDENRGRALLRSACTMGSDFACEQIGRTATGAGAKPQR